MELSRKSIEALLDLVEIKLSCIEISDREDAREVKILQRAKQELCGLAGIEVKAEVIPMPAVTARRIQRAI